MTFFFFFFEIKKFSHYHEIILTTEISRNPTIADKSRNHEANAAAKISQTPTTILYHETTAAAKISQTPTFLYHETTATAGISPSIIADKSYSHETNVAAKISRAPTFRNYCNYTTRLLQLQKSLGIPLSRDEPQIAVAII